MPRKIFVAGEILTAADVNTNLMDQTVMVFDDATARATAIPTPVEGMVTYLKDTDALEKFTGSAFVDVNTDSGKILQVVSTTKTDFFSSSMTSASQVDVTGLEASITPSATSSQVMVMLDISGTNDGGGLGIIIKRAGVGISLGDSAGSRTPVTGGGPSTETFTQMSGRGMILLDSPNTTASTTYSVTLLNTANATQIANINRSNNDNDAARGPRAASRITLMEVAG